MNSFNVSDKKDKKDENVTGGILLIIAFFLMYYGFIYYYGFYDYIGSMAIIFNPTTISYKPTKNVNTGKKYFMFAAVVALFGIANILYNKRLKQKKI